MIGQLNMSGLDKVETAIKRLQTFEPPEGYYLAFSGGKDATWKTPEDAMKWWIEQE